MTTYLLGAVVRLWQHLTRGGISKLERGRARSMAAASAPLHDLPVPEADRELVQAHHEIVVEWRTAEQPVVSQVRRRHVQRPPSRRQLDAMRARRLKPMQDFASDPLSAPLVGPLAPAVIAASVPVSPAPAPWFLESFTTGWTKADVERMVADYKAGAQR